MSVLLVRFVVHAAIVFAAVEVPDSKEPAQRPMVPAELLSALTVEKFERLPKALLADEDALVDQLKALINNPAGDSEESRRFIRRRAVICLGMYGGSKAVPTLRKLAEDKNEPFRRDAVVGIGRTKTKEGVAIAAKFLEHEDELFREAAIDGLGASDREEALQTLKQFDASKDKPFIQRKRREAIDRLTDILSRQPPKP